MQPEFIYIHEAAQKLGIEPKALRQRVRRLRIAGDSHAADGMPMPGTIGNRYAWNREKFAAWIASK